MKVTKLKIYFDENIQEVSNVQINNKINFNIALFAFIYVSILTIGILIYYKKYFSLNIEKGFLLIALVFGSLLICFIPKFTFVSWDDETHFSRAYQLFQYPSIKWTESANQMRTPIPFGIERINTIEECNAAKNYFNINNNYSETISETKKSAFLEYVDYAYIPSGIALSIGRLLHVPFDILLSMGKIANLLFYCLITFLAIKIIPIGKKLLTFIALIPSNIWMATQYSCDPLVTSCIFLTISIFVYEMYNKNKKISIGNSILFIASILYASFAKGVYVPFILLALLFPKEKFNSKKESIIFKIGIIGLFVLIMSTFVIPTISDSSMYTDVRASGTNSFEQLKLIKSYPLSFIKVMYNNAGFYFFDRLISKSTLYNFGYINQINSFNLQYIIIGLLLFFTFTDQQKKEKIMIKNKTALLFLSFIIICLIWSSMYLAYTAVGSIEIQGVQWRYFIPLLLPLCLCLKSHNIINNFKEIKYTQILYYSSFMILLLCIYLNVIKNFYN